MKPQDREALLAQIEAIEQDAYEFGFKSAGGSIVTGVTGERKRLIEVALDQDQVDLILVLTTFFEKNMEWVIDLLISGENKKDYASALNGIIEKLSIHGSVKG